MNRVVSINSIKVSNLLSFGPEGIELDLEPLNVLVGPNGSGKSNFLEVLRLFQSLPNDLNQIFIRGGGKEHWDYKGARKKSQNTPIVELITAPDSMLFLFAAQNEQLQHKISFSLTNSKPSVILEQIALIKPVNVDGEKSGEEKLYDYSQFRRAIISHSAGLFDDLGDEPFNRIIVITNLEYNQSILSQRNDAEAYPALYQLSTLYKGIHIFSETIFGRASPARLPQDAALDSTFLFPDASNLALVLNDLQNQPVVMKTIIEKLKLFYERAENIITRVQGGTVQIYFQEEGLTQTVPASRLSDGTLRYLCLLVILCHPSPPPLICIEEPELGMHPDVLPTIAELLIEASQKTQLIITTHSDLLVSAIGDKHPEAIVVCEKGDNGTTMKRLEPDKMQEWLTRYSLGDLWLKGEIGGTRW